MSPISMYEKETLVFSEVTTKLFLGERRLSSGGSNISYEDLELVVDNCEENSKRNVIYWGIDNLGTVKEIVKKMERVRLEALSLMILLLPSP